MLQQIKRLGTETAIYGISTILGRFLNFLLVPFYTNVLLPGEYGVAAYIFSVIAFINVIYSYGLETAYFKYSSTLEIGTEKENFSTPFVSLLGSTFFFSLIILIFIAPITTVLSLAAQYSSVIYSAAGILAFDAVAIIPFASLRLDHKAKLFAGIKFLNIVINVGMNLILLIIFKMGVRGVFISGLVASASTFLMLLPTVFRHFTLEFNSPLWKALLKFGLPYIPSGLSAMAIQVIDRPILRALTDDSTVGIYQANYRLGIFMMLIVSMYDYAWRPFYFSIAKEKNAKDVFARVLTYLVLIMSAIFLLLTFFMGDLARINIFGRYIIGENYWGGLNIVPVVLLGYVFLGISTNLSAGIYIEKKTQYSPFITGLGAIVNVLANFLLIPLFGILGAAWATFLAYFIMSIAMYIVVQKIYPVRYEISRLLKVACAAMLVMVFYYLLPFHEIFKHAAIILLWKVFLFLVFLFLIYVMKFFKEGEIATIRQLFQNKMKLNTTNTMDQSDMQ